MNVADNRMCHVRHFSKRAARARGRGFSKPGSPLMFEGVGEGDGLDRFISPVSGQYGFEAFQIIDQIDSL